MIAGEARSRGFAALSQHEVVAIAARDAALWIALPAPAGSRPCDDGRDFLFLVDPVAAPPGMAWSALRDAAATDDTLWALYVELLLGGWTPPTRGARTARRGPTRAASAS